MVQKITDNVYVETGFRGCNPGFVVTSEGVVMIDTPMMPVDAVKWRDEIARHGAVRFLVNTEPHFDHFAGNYFFEGIVIAHEGTRMAMLAAPIEQLKDMLKAEAPEGLPVVDRFGYRPPTITLSRQITLYLGKHTFQLISMPGHTPFQVAVYVPEERVVFTSDNVIRQGQAFLGEALPYEWLDSLKQMQQLEADVLVPGHGSICGRSSLTEMGGFIRDWIDAVSAAIDKGMSVEESQDKISLLDRYPVTVGDENVARRIERMNVVHLYELLKSKRHSPS